MGMNCAQSSSRWANDDRPRKKRWKFERGNKAAALEEADEKRGAGVPWEGKKKREAEGT